MCKANSVIALSLLLALTMLQPAHAVVNICSKVGFFDSFLLENLTLSGSCDDADKKISLRVAPTGLQITGLGTNPPIRLRLSDDLNASASGIKQFGVPGHTGTFHVIDADTFTFHLQNTSGGSCDAIAAGGPRCSYTVKTVNAACTNLLPGATVCAPCSSTCPDYGNNVVTIYAAGTPVQECKVTLSRNAANCVTCKGTAIVPK